MKHYLSNLRRTYSQRIRNAGPAGLILINLELALAFIEHNDLPRARRAVCQLAKALDFRYGLSQHLFGIYAVIEKKLTAGIEYNERPAVNDAKHLIQLLLDQWKDTVRASPELRNTGRKPGITIGLTYNASGLCEYVEQDYSGGYEA